NGRQDANERVEGAVPKLDAAAHAAVQRVARRLVLLILLPNALVQAPRGANAQTGLHVRDEGFRGKQQLGLEKIRLRCDQTTIIRIRSAQDSACNSNVSDQAAARPQIIKVSTKASVARC